MRCAAAPARRSSCTPADLVEAEGRAIASARPSAELAATGADACAGLPPTSGRNKKPPVNRGFSSVRDTGIEPVTSSVSGKRATAAPIAPKWAVQFSERWRRDSNPCKRLCRPVPSRSATPPCGLTPRAEGPPKKAPALERMTRLELATPTLARLCATNCATSALFPVVVPGTYETLADERRLSKPGTNLARVQANGHRAAQASGSIG